jgi:hypothetical protein
VANRPPATIIAVTSEAPRHDAVVARAIDLGREAGATVILFDLDADLGPFESPLPTAWSGDGEEEQFGNRLDPNDLEAAGQAGLAKKVGAVRASGVKAFGWLPPKADATSLAEYAAEQSAGLVLVSSEDVDLIEALRTDQGDANMSRIDVEAVAPRATRRP